MAEDDDKKPSEDADINDAEVVSEGDFSKKSDEEINSNLENQIKGELLEELPWSESDQHFPNDPNFPYDLDFGPAESVGKVFDQPPVLEALNRSQVTVVIAPIFADKFCQWALRVHLGAEQFARANTSVASNFPGPLEQTLSDKNTVIAGNLIYVPLEAAQFGVGGMSVPSLRRVLKLAKKRGIKVLISVTGRSQFAPVLSTLGGQDIELPPVDWIKAWLTKLPTEDRVPEDIKQNALERIARFIGEEASQDLTVSDRIDEFTKKADSSSPIARDAFDALVNDLTQAANEEAREQAFIDEMERDWDSDLVKLMMALATLGVGGSEDLRIETVLYLGRKILENNQTVLRKPQIRRVEHQAGNNENYEKSLMEPVEVRGLDVWMDRLDILIRRCGLEVVRKIIPSSVDGEAGKPARVLQFRDGKRPEMLLRLYPGLLTRLGDDIRLAYPLCSHSYEDQGSMVRSVCVMLTKLSEFQPTRFNFDNYWETTIEQLVQFEMESPSRNIFELMYRAFPATQLLYRYWHIARDESEESGDKLLSYARKLVAQRVQQYQSYDPYRSGLFALLYLAINDDYPIAKTTSEFLRILIADSVKTSVLQEATKRLNTQEDAPPTNPENIINITREVLKFVMRESVDVRQRIVLDYYRHRQQKKQTSYYLEFLYARVVYDAMFRDFSEQDDDMKDKLGARIFEGLGDGTSDEIIKAIWSTRINLFDLSARLGDRMWFLAHVADILCKSYEAYSEDLPTAPSSRAVHGLVTKALLNGIQHSLDRSDDSIKRAWEDPKQEAVKTAILDTIDGRPRDEVADILFSGASLVRAVAVSRWPFLSLGERIAPENKPAAKAALLAFPKQLFEHLERADRLELERHWRMLRDVLNECANLARDEWSTRAEADCVVGWVEEKRVEIEMLIDGFSESGRMKALDQKDE